MAKLNSINANLLVVLEAVLDERSVGRAAKRLGVSQSAVSNQLAKLRDMFGDPLLVRVGSSMEFTPRAEALLPLLRTGVAAFNAVLAHPESFAPERCNQRFRVAMVDIAEVALLPRVLARLRQEAPHASLQIFSSGVFEVSRGLMTGELDAVISLIDTDDLGDSFFEAKLYASRFVIIARAGHPQVHGHLTPQEYAALDHVLVTSRPDARGVIDAKLDALDLSRRIVARVPRSILVPPLVASSDLIAAVDIPALLPFGDHLPLQQVTVRGLELPTGAISLVWHERTHRDPACRYLRRVLREESAAISV